MVDSIISHTKMERHDIAESSLILKISLVEMKTKYAQNIDKYSYITVI
jgi:hypothetical protein